MNERLVGPGQSLGDASKPVLDLADLFQRYVESTRLGIVLIDERGIISYVNQSLCSCLGYDADELSGHPVELLLPAVVEFDKILREDAALDCGKPHLMQRQAVRGRRKDGTAVDLAIGLTPLGHDQTTRMTYTLVGLTEPHPAAERTLASFFDLSLDLFCIASVEGFFLRVNPNFTRLLGYSEQELVSSPFLDFVHPDDLAATQYAVAKVVSGQPVVRFRNRYRIKQGGFRWIEWSGRCPPAEGVIFAVGRDVTDELQFEKEIQVREQRERSILENTPAVVYVKAIDGKYLYVNQQFSDLFSLNESSVIGKTDRDIFPPEAAQAFIANDRRVAETRCKLTLEEMAPHSDGMHTYLTVKFPFFDAHGSVSAVAGISTDITDNLHNRELRNQLDVATAFQSKLFPSQAPAVAGLDIAGSAVPVAHLCGDYYDFIVTGPQRLVVVVGDVSGHGLGPALAMVEVRSIIRGMVKDNAGCELAQILFQLNQLLCHDLPDGTFVTLFLAEIDVAESQLQYAGAGHQAMLLRRDSSLLMLESTGPVLGMMESAAYVSPARMSVGVDDLLLMCTDGVTEAMNEHRELFSRRRVVDFCKVHRRLPAKEIIQQLFARVTDFAGRYPIADDMTALVVKFSG